MRPVRAISFASAVLLVAALTALALGVRHRIVRLTPASVEVVLSEVSRQPPPPAPVSPAPAPTAKTGDLPPEAAPTAPQSLPDPDPDPPTIVDPEWVSRPAHPERFYPRAAFLRGVEGRVELACFVETDGRLTCEVASEQPAGMGFADAALEIARAHVMRPAMRNGVPVRARYRMVVPFTSG